MAYSVRLPLKDGKGAILSGLCLDRVTSEFHKYTLTKVTRQLLRSMCKGHCGKSVREKLTKMRKRVGGETDILLDMKYANYFPELIHMFPSGLAVYRSAFWSSDGSDGVIGGPHSEFTKAEKAHRGVHAGTHAYFHSTAKIYRSMCKLQCEVPLLGNKENQVLVMMILGKLKSCIL